MREVVLDTETTGLSPVNGDRIVEIGCVELINHLVTGNTYHQYINPERDMPIGAFEVHGLSTDFLEGYPVFSEIIDDFKKFIGDAPLIIHNAKFDIGFINAELVRLDQPLISLENCVDTVKLAREKFPFASASLDALCKRFRINNSNRKLHGALLDAELLSEVYLQLVGGKQPDFVLSTVSQKTLGVLPNDDLKTQTNRKPRIHKIRSEEKAAHDKFVRTIKNAIWLGSTNQE